jgi:transcription elongation factor GreA
LFKKRPSGGTSRCRPRASGVHRVNTKTTYISKDGLEKLREELAEMTNVRRPEIAQRIHDAKEHGDLSENAEYEDAKNEQAFVEGRIQTLESMIKNATIIEENHSTDHVQIGSTVKVTGEDGEESFTIVGSAEAKPAAGRISNESPVGRALLGRKKGEKVVVKVPAGDFTYKIIEIS